MRNHTRHPELVVDNYWFGKSDPDGLDSNNVASMRSTELPNHPFPIIDGINNTLKSQTLLYCFTGDENFTVRSTLTDQSTSFFDSDSTAVSLSKEDVMKSLTCCSPSSKDDMKQALMNSPPRKIAKSPQGLVHNETPSGIFKSPMKSDPSNEGKSLGKPSCSLTAFFAHIPQQLPPLAFVDRRSLGKTLYRPQNLPLVPFDTTTSAEYYSDLGETNLASFKNQHLPLFPELLMRVENETRGVDYADVFNKPNVFNIINLLEEDDGYEEEKGDACDIAGE